MPATVTKVIQLQKPDVNDRYDLSIWNGNTDKLEQILGPIKLANDKYNMIRINKVGDYWTEIQFKRPDGTLYLRSTLGTPVNGLYTVLTVCIYDTEGLTILDQVVYTLSYDGDRKQTNIILT